MNNEQYQQKREELKKQYPDCSYLVEAVLNGEIREEPVDFSELHHMVNDIPQRTDITNWWNFQQNSLQEWLTEATAAAEDETVKEITNYINHFEDYMRNNLKWYGWAGTLFRKMLSKIKEEAIYPRKLFVQIEPYSDLHIYVDYVNNEKRVFGWTTYSTNTKVPEIYYFGNI